MCAGSQLLYYDLHIRSHLLARGVTKLCLDALVHDAHSDLSAAAVSACVGGEEGGQGISNDANNAIKS